MASLKFTGVSCRLEAAIPLPAQNGSRVSQPSGCDTRKPRQREMSERQKLCPRKWGCQRLHLGRQDRREERQLPTNPRRSGVVAGMSAERWDQVFRKFDSCRRLSALPVIPTLRQLSIADGQLADIWRVRPASEPRPRNDTPTWRRARRSPP